MKTLSKTLLATAALAVITSPALAEGKKNKEIKSIVGYNVTETQTFEGPKARVFKKIDRNGDGAMTFKEYQSYSTVDNEYEIFSLMDSNNSKSVTIEEFVNADVTKGRTQFNSALHGKVKGTNLKVRTLPEVKSYYEPVDPTVVEVRDLNTGEVKLDAEARAELEARGPAYAR